MKKVTAWINLAYLTSRYIFQDTQQRCLVIGFKLDLWDYVPHGTMWQKTYYSIEIKLFHAISSHHHNRLTCSKVQIYIRTYRPTTEIFTEIAKRQGICVARTGSTNCSWWEVEPTSALIGSVYTPPSTSHKWRFRLGFPTKTGIILVVTVCVGGSSN